MCNAEKIDAWALGMTLLEIATGSNPIFIELCGDIYSLVKSKQPKLQDEIERIFHETLFNQFPQIGEGKGFWSLIRDLLQFDAERRIGIKETFNNEWFRTKQLESSKWESTTRNRIKELMQNLFRRTKIASLSQIRVPITDDPLSARYLPLPHFENFVRRTETEEKLKDRLLHLPFDQQCPITACQGMGGVGKTQLAKFIIYQPYIEAKFGEVFWFQG
jgi:serine/threonine protein kinase